MNASNIGNVTTEHHARQIGESNYSLFRILNLVSRLLFNYSSYPLRVISILGLVIAIMSFLIGIYVLIRAIILDTVLPGWSSIMILLSLFNGLLILMLGVIGVYVSRTLQQVSVNAPYHQVEVLGIASKDEN